MSELLDTLLARVRVEATIVGRLDLGAPWGGRVPASDRALVHLVASGAMWLECGGVEQLVAEGDVVVVPGGLGHAVAHARGARLSEATTWPTPGEGALGLRRSLGGDGPKTVLLCAALSLDARTHSLVTRLLPSALHIRAAGAMEIPGLAALLSLIREEVSKPTPLSAHLLARLGELLLLHALRAGVPKSAAARVFDDRVARALTQLYAEPARMWTVATLAKRAGMSRSSFAEAFRAALGESPMQHVTAHRMELAKRRLLEDRDGPVCAVAEYVGYRSEAAFTVAFRRMTGTTPSAFRADARR